MALLDIALPVFLVIALGHGLRRGGFLTAEANGVLTRLVYWVAAPALLLRSAAITPLQSGTHLTGLLVMASVTVVVAIAVYLSAWSARPARRGVITQGAYRSNQVFLGLPLVHNAWGAEAVGEVALVVGLMVVVYNVLSVPVLALPHRDEKAAGWSGVLHGARSIATNPLALGCLVGIALSATSTTLPRVLDTSLDLVGRSALPLALISVGAALDVTRLRLELPTTALVTILKLAVYPALVMVGLTWLGVTGLSMKATVLVAATPTAVASYPMSVELGGDQRLASGLIVGTTLASLPAIVVWLWVLGV